ncbi:MAG: dienelactone hydrolase family protein [Candidatus Eremiobacteraeota bacterium]|nr:dienelactone hydrolase family protein [Candidatus Eremiobacteraeota bacterium]
MIAPEIDPTQAPAESFNRRVFVGITAAATLAASTNAASAQEPLGQPHEPIVPEADPAIAVEHVGLENDGATVPAYASWPAGAARGTPSVVVIMHLWGVDAPIRDVVRRYAKAGFAAIAPDLYGRFGAPNGDGVSDSTIFRPYAMRLDRNQWLGDVRAAATWLKTRFPGTKTGITGFCMGGKLVLIATADEGSLFAAAAPFYGAVEGIDPKAIHIPVCGSYGARDTGIPAADVRAFAAALTAPNDFRIYDEAGHAFFDDTRASYVASAATDAWKRTIAFFEKYLGAA